MDVFSQASRILGDIKDAHGGGIGAAREDLRLHIVWFGLVFRTKKVFLDSNEKGAIKAKASEWTTELGSTSRVYL